MPGVGLRLLPPQYEFFIMQDLFNTVDEDVQVILGESEKQIESVQIEDITVFSIGHNYDTECGAVQISMYRC